MLNPSCLFVPLFNIENKKIKSWTTLHPSPLNETRNVPPSHFTTLSPFSPSQHHRPPTFLTFPTLPPSHLQLKHSKKKNIRSSLSPTLVFKRRFTLLELKSKFMFFPPRRRSWTTGLELWFGNHQTTEIRLLWLT